MSLYQPRPRTRNVFLKDSKPLLAKVPHFNGDYLQASIRTSIELLGGLDQIIRPGDAVFLKPNFNCSYHFPLSTDLGMLAALIEVLQDAGARLTVGEMAGRADWPTEKVVANLGVMPVLKRYGVPFVNFQYDDWIELDIPGKFWQTIHVPRSIYEAEKRVYLPNMRCHSSARFSSALKLSVGFLSPDDREILHSDKTCTEGRLAELNLAWQPNLVVVDGRRSTVAWHGRGEYVCPNVIMASGDMVAIDTEVVKILKTFPENNRISNIAVEDLQALRTAVEHGLGSMDYALVEAPANLWTEQEGNLDPAALAVMNEVIKPTSRSEWR
jgi:uncharacterized protein (DUF362 family)